MCGGDIDIGKDQTIGRCLFCGSLMTFPRVTDEQRLNLFNRANYYRQQGEFDRAIAIYDRILDFDANDAEAHWGIVLSRFGIEYVEDPQRHTRIPTCHRVQVTSILHDKDYTSAITYSLDSQSKKLYEEEANQIYSIQQRILSISSKEDPYDVFICFKDKTEDGYRTVDSYEAEVIYKQLISKGWRVFFSRITLKDKLGQEYEPYIFSALNTAKVMIVIGTKPEYFQAVWVKNEWSRYIDMMRTNQNKRLIPCYGNMSVYEMPEELSVIQSLSMKDSDFIKNIIQGVERILGKTKKEESFRKTEEKSKASHQEITKFSAGLQDIVSRQSSNHKRLNTTQKINNEQEKAAYIKNFPLPNTMYDILDFMILATSSIDFAVYSSGDSTEEKLARILPDAWLSKTKQLYSKSKSINGETSIKQQIESLYNNAILQYKEQKKSRTKRTMIVLAMFLALCLVSFVTSKYRTIGEERKLEAIKIEVENELSNKNYNLALMEADTIKYTLSDETRKQYWDIQKEDLINRILSEANNDGIALDYSPKDSKSEKEEKVSLLSGFEKGYNEAYRSIMTEDMEKLYEENKKALEEFYKKFGLSH